MKKQIECPKCKTKFDVSNYLNVLTSKFIKELERGVRKIKEELK